MRSCKCDLLKSQLGLSLFDDFDEMIESVSVGLLKMQA
jgi:hypothetical protein